MVTAAIEGRVRGCVAYQNLLEFYAVVTNPLRVTQPLSARAAREVLSHYLTRLPFRLLHPTDETGVWLLRLLAEIPGRGARVFDLFLAATMLTHGVSAIATFNTNDFSRIPGLVVFDPGEDERAS